MRIRRALVSHSYAPKLGNLLDYAVITMNLSCNMQNCSADLCFFLLEQMIVERFVTQVVWENG